MIKDYYQNLGLRRDACTHEINAQYKRLVLRWHPRFAKEEQQTAHHHFSEISEAYEVLSDPIKRAFFDRHGYLKLREGLFEDGQLKGGYRFASNPDEIFEKFFLHNNPLAQSVQSELLEQGSLFGSAYGGLNYKGCEVIEDLVVDVDCSLHELYKGVAKTIMFFKKVLNADGRTTAPQMQRKLIEIKPGFDPASSLVFKGEGNESVSRKCSDLVIKIKEEPHFEFKRKGQDLFTTAYISLADALDCRSIEVKTLDNRLLRIPVDELISPQTVREVEGEGMPCGKGRKGNLYVRFNLTFPKQLQESKRKELRSLLC